MYFEWDQKKAVANVRKHSITFEEATSVFTDPLSLTIPDVAHSENEDRFITIGLSARERLLVVVHADRNATIRLISARKPTRSEKHDYEDTKA